MGWQRIHSDRLKPGAVLKGLMYPEPVEVLMAGPAEPSVRVVGKGLQTGKACDSIRDDQRIVGLDAPPGWGRVALAPGHLFSGDGLAPRDQHR